MSVRARCLLLTAFVISGCPGSDNNPIPCSVDGSCPAGLHCESDGLCHSGAPSEMAVPPDLLSNDLTHAADLTSTTDLGSRDASPARDLSPAPADLTVADAPIAVDDLTSTPRDAVL